MSSKQMKKLIIIIVAAVLVVGGVFAAIFLFDSDMFETTDDIEAIKAAGNYEQMKADIIEVFSLRDTQGVTFADTMFEKVGIKNYEGYEKGGTHGNYTVFADGYELECFIQGGTVGTIYIGNVNIYKDAKVTVAATATTLEYTYSQYDTLVKAFGRGLDISEGHAKMLYRDLTNMNVNAFVNVKSGKLNGVKGFYGYEGNLKYFLKLDSEDTIDKLYVVCDGFDPLEVYSKSGTAPYELKDVKVTAGTRQGIANVMAYKVKQAANIEVLFPTALLTGDDSWLMVHNGSELYIEVQGEVTKDNGKKSTEDFVIKCDFASRDITYLKMGRKVLVGK